MEVNIIKVGNSKGIIIPAKFMKLIGLKEAVNIDLKKDRLIITPLKKASREGWEEMIIDDIKKSGQPKQLMPDFFEDEKTEDWTW